MSRSVPGREIACKIFRARKHDVVGTEKKKVSMARLFGDSKTTGRGWTIQSLTSHLTNSVVPTLKHANVTLVAE